MKKLIITLSIIIAVMLTATGIFLYTSGLGKVLLDQLSHTKADVSNVEISLAETEHYTAEELTDAATALKSHFSEKNQNMTLDKIWYTDEECLPEVESYKSMYEEKTIALMVQFTTDGREDHAEEGLSSNGSYMWFYLLTKNQDGMWATTNIYGQW